MPRRVVIGQVTSDKSNKTRRVEIARQVQHPVYGKIIRARTVCYVHDEKNQSKVGDTVEIIESAPHSRLKRWELVRIVVQRGELDVAASQAAQESAAADALSNTNQ